MPVDNYKVDENDNHKMTAKNTSQRAYDARGRKSASKAASITVDTCRTVSSRNDLLDPGLQLEEEKNHSLSKFNAKGKRTVYGLWYDHPRYDHSVKEIAIGQGHPACV